MDFEKARQRKRDLIPTEGFHVVGIDSFVMPDEALYFIAYSTTLYKAQRIVAKKEAAGIRTFIYDPYTL
ncbi:MAG: hypothetical protein ACJAVL_001472 [Bacteroidia bacterium]|jgi:hypothetical protein